MTIEETKAVLDEACETLTLPMVDELPPCIVDEIKKLDATRAELMRLKDVAIVAHLVANAHPELEIRVSFTQWHFEPIFVTMMVYVKSFKELTPLFQSLAQAGWRTDKDKPFTDYPELERRTYNLGAPTSVDPFNGGKGGHRLRVMAFPTKDGATCKKVQIGTKEEPVYELVCE